jgi:autoinducer 2-degrading protein
MHVTLVHVKVKPDRVDAFVEATRRNHEGSMKEPGNRRFDVLQDPADPTVFLLYEVYAEASDAAAHKTMAHYLAWRDAVADMMAEPRRGVSYLGLLPASPPPPCGPLGCASPPQAGEGSNQVPSLPQAGEGRGGGK